MSEWDRYIIHIDMDAFYASVEQRDDPALKGKPVIVGGKPRSRGVVASCSYEARKFGIHSAMASSKALRLCPDAIFVRPRFDVYKEVSRRIMEIFYEYSSLVEPISLDEAYLDVTGSVNSGGEAVRIAEEIRKRVLSETGLNSSAGISFNKFLAKVASDINKPDGIKVIPPESADEFIDYLPIRKFRGVGRVTEEKMVRRGILKGSDLKRYSKAELVKVFGRSGAWFYNMAHCIDDRQVAAPRQRRSIGHERTLSEDTDDIGMMKERLGGIARALESSMIKRRLKGRTVTLKLRYEDFSRITRSMTLLEPLNDAVSLGRVATILLSRTEAGRSKVRLLGISVSGLQSMEDHQRVIRQMTLDRWS